MAHVNKTYIFDLELSTPIITDGSEPGYGIVEYVTNWKDHHLMKVACLCAIELNNEAAPLVFLQDNLEGFSDLITEDAFFVSYNGKAFDLPVLLKHRIVITPNQHCDLLEEIHRATRRRVKLDDLAKANLGLSKSGSGAAAPYEWQRGKFGSVVSYCLNDCFVLLKVYQKAREQGFLLNPYDGGRIPLSLNKQSASLFQ